MRHPISQSRWFSKFCKLPQIEIEEMDDNDICSPITHAPWQHDACQQLNATVVNLLHATFPGPKLSLASVPLSDQLKWRGTITIRKATITDEIFADCNWLFMGVEFLQI